MIPHVCLPRRRTPLFALCLPLVLAAWALAAGWPPATLAQQDGESLPKGRVEGKVVGHPEADRTVVLLQFRLNAEGQPEGGPIGRTATAEGGTFVFTDVPIDSQTVYRLGTRIDERLVGSDPFTFPRGETVVLHDLMPPEVRTDQSTLGARELLWVAEARTGAFWITEVLHLENPGEDYVSLENGPLELALPADADELEVMRNDLEAGAHERLGPKLLVTGTVPAGIAVVAFRYRVPAPLGEAAWTHAYNIPLAAWRVLSPDQALHAEGEGLEAGPEETYDGVNYAAWSRESVEPGTPLTIRLTGAPIHQGILLTPLVGFAVLIVGLLVWYLRTRARKPEPPPLERPTASA